MPYSDKWGRFYSAYSPVFDSNGKVSGIVAVDFSADWYEKQVHYQIRTIIIITILSLSFGAAIVLMIASRSRKRFKLLYRELNDLTDGIETLAGELSDGMVLEGTELLHRNDKELSASDEIDYMADKISSLEEYMRLQIGYVRSKAYKDGLTGLDNRTSYLEYITKINEQIVDQTACFSVAMFDINGLKDINDEKGHDKGDKQIIKASMLLKRSFPDDHIFRIGGDEFVVIINRPGEVAKKLMDDCQNMISVERSTGSKYIIMSTGYAEYDGSTDKTYQDTFEKADRTMYENKKNYYETLGDRRHR